MKKLLILMILMLTITISGANAALVPSDFNFFTYDNATYDLLTGVYEEDINYSTTNRILIPNNSNDNTLYFNNINFHHILFYDDFNTYIGYANTDNTTLQLASYLGYDLNSATGEIVWPDGAKKFALIVYNYGDTRAQTAYTYDSIDIEAYNGKTYREIFGSTNEYDTVDFPDGDILYGSGYSINSITDSLTTQYFGRDYNNVLQDLISWNVDNELTNTIRFLKDVQSVLPFKSTVDTSTLGLIALKIGDITYPVVTFSSMGALDYPCIAIRESGYLYIKVNKSTLGGILSSDFELYLQSNEVEFIYELDTSITRADEFTYISTIDIGDEPFIYNFSQIFGLGSEPTTEEFEIMKEYYLLNVDVSGLELTYNQIINNNELMPTTGYVNLANSYNFIYDDDILSFDKFDESASYFYSRVNIVLPESSYYINYNFKTDIFNEGFNFRYEINSATNYVGFYYDIPTDFVNEAFIYNGDITQLRFLPQFSTLNTSRTFYLNFSYSHVFDLTDIFTENHEPDIETFEGYYNIWVDPLDDYYLYYYQAANISTLEIHYIYDDTPAADPDAQNTIDDSLTAIGVDTEESKVFLALGIMILAAVVIGLKLQSTSFVILAEVVLTLIFTMLGWFSFWILLLIALSFVLLIIRLGLKGGN